MWKIVQCAVQGRSHIKTDVPCQDKTFSIEENGVTVIALADGAGSARLSHHGAQRVTEFICRDFATNFAEYYLAEDGASVKKELVSKIMIELGSLSKELDCEIKELASTLMFVAIKDKNFIIAHIGDGVVGYLKENELKIASQPENGEFTNTTVFTTSNDALMTMKLLKGNLGAIRGFVLMSDGTEASLYNKREKKLADVIKKVMDLMIVMSTDKIEEQLTNSFESTIKRATTDDCSIVIMVDDQEGFSGYQNLSVEKKIQLLGFQTSVSKNKLKRYDTILESLVTEGSLNSIARAIHLNPKYTKKHIERLVQFNLVEKVGVNYRTNLIMK